MKVWILETGIYEDRGTAGVYATAEAAMAAHSKGKWLQELNGGWTNGLDWEDSASITPYEVQGP